MTTTQFLETYQKYGLEINSATGGQQLESGEPTVTKMTEDGEYEIDFNGYKVTLFSSKLFLDTVKQTEKSLKVQLFK